MKLKLLGLFMMCLTFMTVSAQRNCGSTEYLENQIKNNPERMKDLDKIERQIRHFEGSGAPRQVVTIPVVVHVVYRTATENISDAQIQSQIDVLNADFRRLNSDADNTWSQAADAEIEFCLASVDPNGNATNGITRTSTTVNGFGTNDRVKYTNQGGKDAWPRDSYLNFWVCNIGGGILGYAQFPGGAAATDGVVNDYRYTGTNGTATAPFNLGRTATHEVGHWLNLRHIWGDGGCGVDDFVSDTPESDAANYSCAAGHTSCGSTDMVQNYMDYSDDACMNLFTQGQKTRMQALFAPGGFRASLLNSAGCGSGVQPTCNDGVQNGNETGVDCGGDCAACPTCDDGVQNGNETGVDCGGDCAACPSNCTENQVTVTITFDNYPEETSWVINNASGTAVASGGTYGSQADGSTLTIEECLPDGCYDFVINDSYGDGICCSYGNGSYSVTSDGNTLASGATFTSSESTNFCLGGGPTPTCDDGVQNGDETGVDCGGSCTACPTCDDGIQNGNETGVDCGGDCAACPTCDDGVQNGNETGVDCGGDCAACPTCDDGVQNGNETGVDCGGSCAACPTCDDGIQNGNETGVDCGGDCAACPTGCNDNTVVVTITFDNYPEETSWVINNASGTAVASGGTYGSQPDGSTLTIEECLPNGCYDFVINDAYGDGICCSYGNGSYTVTSAGSTLASGGSFTSSESTNFCLGDTPPAPTCDDGVQNGDETGIDCGGSCTPCNTGGGDAQILASYFESGWDGWQDGGSDCYRYTGERSYEGSYSIRIRDNSGTASSMTSPNLDLAGNSSVTVDFYFYPNSMENGEDFWLRYNDGSGWQTVGTWTSGSGFSNNSFYSASVTLSTSDYNLTDGAQFRFQCDASSNADRVYVDQVIITGSGTASRLAGQTINEMHSLANVRLTELDTDISLSPNPTSNMLYLTAEEPITGFKVFSATGQQMIEMNNLKDTDTNVDVSSLSSGIYFITIETAEEVSTQKFIKE